MESSNIRDKLAHHMRQLIDSTIIVNRRFLDDEQLIKSEQLAVLEEIFNANVRDAELREISCHFACILRGDHPVHLALWGKTGAGKTLTISYFLNLLSEMCKEKNITLRFEHLDISTPRPCFRALNDLACLLNASRRYKRGISLEELMLRIESALADYRGYLILFIDEVDNVRRDKDTFLTFLVRRLPQKIHAKLVLVFASNKINCLEFIDPRIKSFLKQNDVFFTPYNAVDLQKILQIRVQKALKPDVVEEGVIEKIAALASRDHGDARKAVALLAKSAYLAEKAGSTVTLDLVDQAANEIEQDKYLLMIRTAPVQLKAVMAAVIHASRRQKKDILNTGDVYDAYKTFGQRVGIRILTSRSVNDLLMELEMISLIRCRVLSKGRYGRTRQIVLDIQEDVIEKVYQSILRHFETPSG